MSDAQRRATDPTLGHIDVVPTLEAAQRTNALDPSVAAALEPRLPTIARSADAIAAASHVAADSSTSTRLAGPARRPRCQRVPAHLRHRSIPGRVLIASGTAALTTAIEGAENNEAAAVRDLDAIDLTADDAVVGVSASGRTPYVIAAIRETRRRSAASVSVACNAGSAAGKVADIAIDVVVGPEFVAGAIRL